jgi:hypothetical protein
MSKTFKTSEVLAAIHAFPSILAARENTGIIEAFDKLRAVTLKMAGVDGATDHLGWCELANSLKPTLSRYFSSLSAEKIPDPEYWHAPPKIEKDKIARLGAWVQDMEKKYGATQEVPDLSADVTADMKRKAAQAPALRP